MDGGDGLYNDVNVLNATQLFLFGGGVNCTAWLVGS